MSDKSKHPECDLCHEHKAGTEIRELYDDTEMQLCEDCFLEHTRKCGRCHKHAMAEDMEEIPRQRAKYGGWSLCPWCHDWVMYRAKPGADAMEAYKERREREETRS